MLKACLLIVFILIASLNAEINLVLSSPERMVVEYEMNHYEIVEMEVDGKLYSRIIANGCESLAPGSPDLPAFRRLLAIVRGTRAEVRVTAGSYREEQVKKMIPVREPAFEVKGANEPGYKEDRTIYNSVKDFPGKLAEIKDIANYRSQPMGILQIYPYQYNPQKGILRIYETLRIEVNFVGAREPLTANLVNPVMEQYIRDISINGSEIVESEPDRQNQRNRNRDSGSDFLIICPAEFESAAIELEGWKERKGIITEVVTTSEIGATAFSIRDFIVEYCAESDIAPQYILLFGDAENIPPWYVHEDLYEGQMLGTDVYYADLEVTFDYLSDFGIGRIPVDTMEDAERAVANIINYEQIPPSDAGFYQTALITGAFQDGSYGMEPDGYADRRFAKTAEDVRNFLNDEGYNAERHYAEFNGNSQDEIFPTYWNLNYYLFENDTGGAELAFELQKPQYAWDAIGQDITLGVNAGSFLLVHRDHGCRQGWGEPLYFKMTIRIAPHK